MRDKLGGILRCATVSTFQTTPIAGCKEKCGLDLSLLLSVSSVCSDDSGYDGRGPPTGVAVRLLLPGEMAPPRGQMWYYTHPRAVIPNPGCVYPSGHASALQGDRFIAFNNLFTRR